MENWNDLKLVLAIARAGRLAGGAQSLGIDHSTGFRRLNAMEERLGVKLFERRPGGEYALTADGQRFAATAELVETEMMSLDRDVLGRDARPTGTIRVTAPEALAYAVLPSLLRAFRSAYPGIVVEVIAEDRVLSLSRREADVALRDSPQGPDLFGRKLVDVRWALYAAASIMEEEPKPKRVEDLARHEMIGWGMGSNSMAATWLERQVPEAAFVYRSANILSQLAAARAGIGIALLPCYLGDPQPDLRRVFRTPVQELTRELWIVTHADLKKTARIRAFFDSVGQALAAQHKLFSGG
jgi:molybdate transport repressor ModE-like protein